MNNYIGQGIQIGDRAVIAHFRAFNAEGFGLAIDPFTGGALIVKGMEEGILAIQGDALNATEFPVDIFDTAVALGELFV